MRIATSQMFSQGLNAILDQQAELTKTQIQIANGKKISAASDDPAGASRILGLREAVEITRQFQTNASAATSRLSLEDTVLDNVTNVLQRVRELALQGNNATLTSQDRQGLAVELEQRLDELLGLANTKDGNDEFLFGGFSTRTQPFAADGTGGFVYNGDQGQRRIQIAPAIRIADGNSGSEVFQAILNGNGTFRTADDPVNLGSGLIDAGDVVDPSSWIVDNYTINFTTDSNFEVLDGTLTPILTGPYDSGSVISFNGIQVAITGAPVAGDRFTVSPSARQDMFTTVQALATAFAAPDSDGAGAARLHNAANRALADLDQALENVRGVRAGIGGRLNAIETEQSVNADFELQLRADLSRAEDVDLAEVISRLNQQLVSLQAAQESFARLQNMTLFNFL